MSQPPSRPAGAPARSSITAEIPSAPALQFSNGLIESRQSGEAHFTKGYVGFHTQFGLSKHVDDWARQAHIPQMEVRHPRERGQADIVTYWNFGARIGFIPITYGPKAATIAATKRNPGFYRATAEAGIGLYWPDTPPATPANPYPKRAKSKLAVRGYLVVRVLNGVVACPHVLQLTTHSRMTDKLFHALYVHLLVCHAADIVWNRQQAPVDPYELMMPLVPSEPESWGSGAGSNLVTPFAVGHPMAAQLMAAARLERQAQIAEFQRIVPPTYLQSIRSSQKVLEDVIVQWSGVQAWAVQFCFPPAQAGQIDTGEESTDD